MLNDDTAPNWVHLVLEEVSRGDCPGRKLGSAGSESYSISVVWSGREDLAFGPAPSLTGA
jgi:hypothetical protein